MVEREALFLGAPFQDKGEVALAQEDESGGALKLLLVAPLAQVFLVAHHVADGTTEVAVTAPGSCH